MTCTFTSVCLINKQTSQKGGLLTDAAPLLAGRLVKPGLDIVLPMLFEVAVGDNVVVLHHFVLPAHTMAKTSPHEQNNSYKLSPLQTTEKYGIL